MNLKKASRILFWAILSFTLFIFAGNVNANGDDRVTLNMNTDWLYLPADVSNGQISDLDERNFTQVSVPHANKILDKHLNINVNDFRFVSWYRRHFSLDSKYSGNRIFVEFQGVATVADVYVNGKHITQHKGAYTGFNVDITDYVKFGDADNLLAVKVDSTRRPDIPPEGDRVDYALFGGIVRDVKMVITNPVYIADIFITTPQISKKEALINSKMLISNQTNEEKKITVETIIKDATDKTVARGSKNLTVESGKSEEISTDTSRISVPRLWDIDDPYLYSATVNIKDGKNLVDSMTIPIGIRSFEFTKNGFFLNGRAVELFGLNRHEQFPWIGRAAPNRLQKRDAEILKFELGCNIVRLSHYPQDPEFIKRADEIGLMLLEELPGWQHIGDDAWKEIAKENLREMILRDRNHPSIISWGVRINESNDSTDFYAETNKIAMSLDPTRPTHGVRTNENHDGEYQENGFFGFNDYNCWDGTTKVKKPRDMPWLITETNCKWKTVLPNSSDANWVEHMKEFARIHEVAMQNERILGTIGWSYVDYNTEVDYNNTNKNFYSGVYDIFRLPRFSAAFYKSQRNPKIYGAMVKIASFWTPDSPKTVTIGGNTEEIELFLNGKSLGIYKPNLYNDLNYPLFEIPVEFQPGELRAEGRINGRVVATDKVNTPGEAVKIEVIPDSNSLIADGSDLTGVTIRAVDSKGNWVPYAAPNVKFTINGAGHLLGENPLTLENGRASIYVQSIQGKRGTVSFSADADGLQKGVAKVSVTKMTAFTVPVSKAQAGTITPQIKK